jgi:hypothetical protein
MSLTDDNEDQLYDREFWQRLNQDYSRAGVAPVMPWEQDAITAMAEELNRNIASELPHDHDPVARRIAGHMVKEHIKAWDAAGKRSVYTRWHPDHDEFRSDTLATLYALSYSGDPAWIVAMQDLSQLQEVADDALKGGWRCTVRVTRLCDGVQATDPNKQSATKYLAVKRGEYICLFNSCRACLEHIHTGAGFNDDYIGPDHDWLDDREAQPLPPRPKGWDDPWSNPDDDDGNS